MIKKNKTRNLAATEGWTAIIGNTLLFGLKYWAGAVTGSIALIADAWHTLTDSISSVIVLASAHVSQKPADEKHPFGHGRLDLISSVIIGTILGFIGLEFLIKSINSLKGGEGVVFGKIAIWVTIVSIVVKEAMAQYAFWVARKTGNSMIKADGWHHRTDALSSIIILVGIFIGRYFWWIDGVLGIAVALLIFYAAFEILKDSINRLMGETPDQDLILSVNKIIKELELDVCPHHFHTHSYGNHIEMTFHILLPGDLSLEQSYEKNIQIVEAIRKELGIEATIHMQPYKETLKPKTK